MSHSAPPHLINGDNKKEHKLKVYEIDFYLYSVDEKSKIHHISNITQYVILTRFDKTYVQTFQNQFFQIIFIFFIMFVSSLRTVFWIFRKIIKFMDDKRQQLWNSKIINSKRNIFRPYVCFQKNVQKWAYCKLFCQISAEQF